MNFLQDSNPGVFNNLDFTILYDMVVYVDEANMANIYTHAHSDKVACSSTTMTGGYCVQTFPLAPQWQTNANVLRTMRDCALNVIRMMSMVDNDMAIAIRLSPHASYGSETCVYLTINDHNYNPTPVMFRLDRIEEAAACTLASAIMVQDHKAILDLYVIQMAMDMASGKHPE